MVSQLHDFTLSTVMAQLLGFIVNIGFQSVKQLHMYMHMYIYIYIHVCVTCASIMDIHILSYII